MKTVKALHFIEKYSNAKQLMAEDIPVKIVDFRDLIAAKKNQRQAQRSR